VSIGIVRMKQALFLFLFCCSVGQSFRLAPTTISRPTFLSKASATALEPVSPKKVLVLGGDGFCGWPTSLYLSEHGHEVIVVDNLSRRKIDVELGCDSLTPIFPIEERCKTWNDITQKSIRYKYLDLEHDYADFLSLLKNEKPDTIVHFAEQRAAPYSMKDDRRKRYTVNNNVGGTSNVLCAMVESGLDIHLVHLGTMGVYGYGTSGGEIPEGYLDVLLPGGKKSTILHPANPGSVYHLTKCLDALMFQFYNKNDGLRITDLHQGIVWGTNTPQTIRDERLINRFDYDGDYGTVLNRFLMQASLNIPLTVYGTGGQTRAFIHITDTTRCINLAINNPPKSGTKVEIFNQVAETLNVGELAKVIADKTGCAIRNLANPRKEDAENELEVLQDDTRVYTTCTWNDSNNNECDYFRFMFLKVSNRKFCNLGLNPVTLQEGLMDEVVNIAGKFASRCNPKKVLPSSYWNKARAAASAVDSAR
jgi:UDP-sulfoquinovose synthase